MIQVRVSESQFILPLRVTPRGGKDCLQPFEVGDTVLKLKVSAPPEDGKANGAVVRLLADRLGVPKGRVAVIAGDKARNKQVAIQATANDCPALLERLAQHLSSTSAACFQVVIKD